MKKILIISNKYQLFGGTEQVVNNEIKLLKKQGYSVELLEFDNNEIKQYGLIEKILFLIKSIYNYESKQIIIKKIKTFNPDFIHLHNIYPLISLSIYHAMKTQRH